MMESNRPLISIIVPIYNVADYVEHCISGITNQIYKNLEIILVDDGATDGSAQICDRFAQTDSRIKVLHITNGGQSRARNKGLDIATGDYIGFVDGDDAPLPDMYETMVNLAIDRNLDIVECNFTGRKTPAQLLPGVGETSIISGHEALKLQLEHSRISSYPSTSVWSKLFKREVIGELRFPEGRIHEEFAFLAEAMLNSEKYGYINLELYERVLRNDSTTAAPYSKRSWDKYYVYGLRNELLKRRDEKELLALSVRETKKLKLHLIKQAVKSKLKRG